MKYDLVGYLLGALESAEHSEVADALKQDARLRQQLARLVDRLEPLEACRHLEPPAGLARKTLEAVFAEDQPVSLPGNAFSAQQGERGVHGGWSLLDGLFAVGLVLILALLLLPAVVNSRFMADIRACQNNLREIGSAMRQYSDIHQGYFPVIPSDGNLAVAGAYSQILVDNGLLQDRRLVYCPAAAGIPDRMSVQPVTEGLLPSLDDTQLAMLQEDIGGDYGYNIGYVRNGNYRPHRNLRRPYFPLMADTPSLATTTRASMNHDGMGQNVLFEDGSVRFLRESETPQHDMLYLSDRGRIEPGRHQNDSVIVESSRTILPVQLMNQ